MVYYRVKKEYDNNRVNPRVHDANILVANELYTEKEFDKMVRLNSRLLEMVDKVSIPKNRTYFFFGARFDSDSEMEV